MPFCPQCKFEYEPEIEICPECKERLVAELPAGKGAERSTEESTWQELVTVYSTLLYGDAVLMESFLKGSDVPAVLTNEQVGRTVYAPLTVEGFQVQVPPQYVDRARAILEEAEHLSEQAEAPQAPRSEEMDLPEMDDDGEV